MVGNIENLMKLGFSEYESRAYLALIKENPLTAYETAGSSGIPSSKIYSVLAKLQSKGLVLEIRDGNKKHYIPQDSDEFLASYRYRMDSQLRELKKGFSRIAQSPQMSYIWNINYYEDLVEKAERLILKAEKYLLLSVWEEEAEHLKPILSERVDAGLPCASVYFGENGNLPGMVFDHPIQDTLYRERGGRGFSLVCDGAEALVGTISEAGISEGAFSSSPGFVIQTEDYIKHDIYIMKIVKRFDHKLKHYFGPGYEDLRDIFSDRDRGSRKEKR